MTADAVWEQRDPRIDAAMPALRRLVIAVHHPHHTTAVRETDRALQDAIDALAGPEQQPPGWRLLAIVLAAMVPACAPDGQLLGWTEDREHYHSLLRAGMHSCHASAAAAHAAETRAAQIRAWDVHQRATSST